MELQGVTDNRPPPPRFTRKVDPFFPFRISLTLPPHHPNQAIPHRHQARVAQLLNGFAKGPVTVFGVIGIGQAAGFALIPPSSYRDPAHNAGWEVGRTGKIRTALVGIKPPGRGYAGNAASETSETL